jgi:hypothetical protein
VHNKVIRRLARYIPLDSPLMIVRTNVKEKPVKAAKPEPKPKQKKRKRR